MKKILFLLLATVTMYGQVPADATPLENIQITNNTTDNSATKVVVQSASNVLNTISKSDLVNVVEVNDVPSLPLVGEVGKIYVVKNVNKIYRWNGTFYQELAGSDINYQSIIDALTFTPENVANKVTSIGSSANDTNYPSELSVKTYADNLVVGMLNDRGTWDASGNVFPTTGGSGTAGAIRKGDMWYVLVAGTLGTKLVNVGDSFRALVNAPSQVATDWSILEANIGYVPANDNAVVHLAGTETITGLKTFNPSVSASSAVARGTYFTPKLSATANNDILVGLDINPTFTNGSFTGVKNISARFNGLADVRASGMGSKFSFGDGSLYFGWNNGNYLDIISADGLRVGNQASTKLQLFSNTGSLVIQNGGTFTDDGVNRLQVAGTVSSGTTTAGNTPPTANNQLTRKDYVDTGLALKANLASPALTGTPTAPTATVGANTTQVATTAFVTNGIATADSQNVKLTGNQTISGQKSFSLTGKIDMQTNNAFPAISVTALGSNGGSAAEFINNSSFPYSNALRLYTSSSGGVGNRTLDVLNTSPIGTGIVSEASNGGVSISSQSGNGDSYISNITSGGTGRNYVGRNNGTETYSVDKIGNVLGNSYIKRSTPANNILLAGGGDIAQNTAFNKPFGTTASTVAEGNDSRILNGQTAFSWGNHASAGYALTTGSNINQSSFRTALGLGSNAYTSTAYLPLINDYVGLSEIRAYRNYSGSSPGFELVNTIGETTVAFNGNLGRANFSETVTATSYTATSLPVFENNAAASSLAVGQFYRTSIGVLMVKF